MTPLDAAGLSLLALRHRRLATLLVLNALGRSFPNEDESLPARSPNETFLQWADRLLVLSSCRRSERACLEAAATTLLACATRSGIKPLPVGCAGYPARLAAIPDPPPMLWIRGEPDVLAAPSVALVGSRSASPYGLAMAARLAADLAAAGVVVVSGLARGVDSAAHRAVLNGGGRTVGVLGCGIDRIYPPEHRELAGSMTAAGAVVSEFPLGVAPRRHHFPLRNRIISGLATGVVVVEASEKSGALITAGTAADQGREVMVVPGPVTGDRHRGGHLLIRDGARMVESAFDILQELGLRIAATTVNGSGPPSDGLPDATDFTVDDVSARTGEAPASVLTRLLELELAGRIQRIGGGRFARVLT